jgi:hypothetical protein
MTHPLTFPGVLLLVMQAAIHHTTMSLFRTCQFLVAACAAFTVSAVGAAPDAGAPAIELGELPLLFADDSGIAASAGVVRTVYVAHTRDAPVLEAEREWEGSRVYIYGSVHFDAAARRLSMWYLGHPDVDEQGGKPAVPGFRKGKGDAVLYATSQDGLHWERPALGLHSFQGTTANNIVFDLHSPSVLVDGRETDPAKRYKMLGSLRGAYYAAVSADGLKWTRFPDDKPILKSSDNISLTQDPRTGEYLAFHRQPAKRGRTVSLSRSRDFAIWSEPELVFAPDAEDDHWAKASGERTEVNNMSVFPHAAGFIGLPTIFRVLAVQDPQVKLAPGQSSTDGIVDVQLITSENGRIWRRTHPRVSVIARGAAGNFDGGTILGVSSTCVHVGEETWVYYTGLTTSHGATVPPKRISIGRAEWRRHGFVSLDAGIAGRVQTKPLHLSAPSLMVNANARGGELRVALLEADGSPMAGFSAEECEPLRADKTRWTPRWRDRKPVPTDRPVCVAIQLNNARLFSLSSEPAPNESPSK